MANIRDIGVAISNLLKPDGSAISTRALTQSLPIGSVSRITGLLPARAADPVQDGITKILQKEGKIPVNSGTNLENIILNPLENLTSYAPMWTMAALDKNQFNNPTTYRNGPGDLKYVVFSSGGRFDSQRVNTAHGAPEYFINNFSMQTTISATAQTGNSNAFKFTFEVLEPHTMGLFLQSLQNAAIKAGFANYNSAPFVLRLDIMGYNDLGQVYTSIKPKFWTLRLIKATFSVDENGSKYKVEAVPYNSKGFTDAINTAYTDVKLACSAKGVGAGTVLDLLTTGSNSLCKYLNDNEQKLLDEKKIGVKDIYIIEFPEKSDEFINSAQVPGVTKRATKDPNAPIKTTITGKDVEVQLEFGKNDIGKADFGFDAASGGNYSFAQVGDSVDEKTGVVQRDKMAIDPKQRTFQFAQEQRLTTIINQVILSSTYAKKALDPQNLVNGFIKWWRLDVQIQLLDLDIQTGEYAMKYIYRVVPFLVHHSIFSPPTTVPIGYQELQKQIVKQYNYIYTGQNTDVLKFDIQIDNLFYTGTSPTAEAKSGKIGNQDQKGIGTNPAKEVVTTVGAAPVAVTAANGRKRVMRDPELIKKTVGGSGDAKETEQQVAETFHKVFTSAGSGDLVKVNLEILGDPYWMADSGISNYFARPSDKSRFLSEDGTVNYEGGDVFIYLTFRTPSDIDEVTGLYQWPTAGKESPFSGIFRVTQCENVFADGVFKQKLTCLRQVGQSQDFKDGNPNNIGQIVMDKAKSLAVSFGKDVPVPATPAEEQKVEDPSGPRRPATTMEA
jgi:hypothetical protein